MNGRIPYAYSYISAHMYCTFAMSCLWQTANFSRAKNNQKNFMQNYIEKYTKKMSDDRDRNYSLFFFLFVFASLRKSFGSFGGCRWCTHTAAWTTVCSDSAYQSICVILVGALRWTRTIRKTWTSILFYNMRHSVKCFGYVNRVHSPRCWSLWISFDRFTRCTHRKEHSPNRCTRK